MKEKLNNKYLAWGLTIFCVMAALMLLFFAIYRWNYIYNAFITFLNIVMPFIFGLVIAYLMNPFVCFFENKIFSKVKNGKKRRIKIARVLSITTSSIIFLGCLIGLISFFIPELLKSLDMFIQNSTTYLNNSKDLLIGFFGGRGGIEEFINNNYDTFQKFFVNWLNEGVLNDMMTNLGNSIFGTLKFLYNFVIGYIISIYVLYDKEKFKAQTKKLLYSLFDDDKINLILENVKYTDRIFSDFFSAKLLDSLIIGVICFVAMLIFDMPYALIIAVVVGVTNIIPYFGPFIGAIPSALLILLVDPTKCISFIIFIFVLQQFDGNILGPKILGGKTGLSSFWVLFSLLIFGGLFGVVGMIIGVPIFSIFYSFINGLLKKRLSNKELPTDSKYYEQSYDLKNGKKNKAV